MAEVNPFVYATPLDPAEIVDREGEVEELLALARGRHYVRLSAPRKFGKTSLLLRVLRDAEAADGTIGVLVDFYGVVSLADVAVRIERAYARDLQAGVRERVNRFLQRTGLGLSLSAMGIGAALRLEPRADPLPAVHALLDLPQRLAEEGRRALIVFDEFQDVVKVAGVDALIRSHIQYQSELASYVFSGSEPGLMRQLFDRRDRPLYGQAVPFRIGRLPDGPLAAHVAGRFERTGRDAGEALAPLLRTARGHPQRAMLLAHELWRRTPRGGAAELETWEATLADALVGLGPELEARWQRLTGNEQKTIRALLAGGGSPYRVAVLERLALPKASAQQALRSLMGRAEVERAPERGYELVDPLFAVWVERLGDGGV